MLLVSDLFENDVFFNCDYRIVTESIGNREIILYDSRSQLTSIPMNMLLDLCVNEIGIVDGLLRVFVKE